MNNQENLYLSGKEGMMRLLDCCTGDPMTLFKKDIYTEAFHKMYQDNIRTFEVIEIWYRTDIDKDLFLTHMADALVNSALEKIQVCTNKHQKDRRLMDLNLIMAVFVLPMILEFRGQSSVPLTEKIIESWKREFPKHPIQAAEFSYIEQGFHKKFCYITTAVCESLGRDDDCYELNVLRDFRDQYLAGLPEGLKMIRKYYDVAPTIVKHINNRENAQAIYQEIWTQYLAPCISMIEKNEREDCCRLYCGMVEALRMKYFYQ